MASKVFNEILRKSFSHDNMTNLEKEQHVGTKSDLSNLETLTNESNGDRIDKLDDDGFKEISDGSLSENEYGTIHCFSEYLGEFDYDPKVFAYGYKEIQEEDGTTSQLPVLKYIGKNRSTGVKVPEGLKTGDYMFEGNEELIEQPHLPESLESSHCMFANCKNLTVDGTPIEPVTNLKKEESVGAKSDLTGVETVLIENGDRIDRLDYGETKEISDGTLTKNEDGTVHCKSEYLGEFDYKPRFFTYGYKEIQEEDGTTSQLPILKYIGGREYDIDNLEMPEGLKSGDYMFEGNDYLTQKPNLPESLQSSHCMFANCKNLMVDKNLKKEQTLGEKSDLSGVATVTTESNGDRIDKLDDDKIKRISDGSLTKNEDGTVHCKSDYLGEFDYDPKDFAYGYKEIQAEDGTTSQLPILKYIGNAYTGALLEIPNGLKSGDYMFEGNKTLEEQPKLPNSLTSAHYMFANCENLTSVVYQRYSSIPMGLKDASGMYKGSSEFQGDSVYRPNGIVYAEEMIDGTAIDRKLEDDAFYKTNSYEYENPYMNKKDVFKYLYYANSDETEPFWKKNLEKEQEEDTKSDLSNLEKEQTVGEKSDLSGVATVTTDSNGNRIDNLEKEEIKEISDGSLTKNENGTVHCKSDYLGEFDYDPKDFAYGYKEIQAEDGTTSQLPILKYIGKGEGHYLDIPEGLKSGDYTFEGNETLVDQPSLPKSLKSAHYMFANCEKLAYAPTGDWKSYTNGEMYSEIDIPEGLEDASGMYKDSTKFTADYVEKVNEIANTEGMFDGTATCERHKQIENLEKEQHVGTKSDLSGVETVLTQGNGDRIDKLDDDKIKRISDGTLRQNEDGTVHCSSYYLGEFDYDPKDFAYGYKEIQEEDGRTSQLPVLKYIGKDDGHDLKIPNGLKSGDYMFEGNETLVDQPHLPYSLKSAHYMFANCEKLAYAPTGDWKSYTNGEMYSEIDIPEGLEDASGMYKDSTKFTADYVEKVNEIANTEGMFDGTATQERHKQMKLTENLAKEQQVGKKSDLSVTETVTIEGNGDRIDKLDNEEGYKRISDGSLTKNENGTVHCKSYYLGEFDYDPEVFAFGYKEIYEEGGKTSKLPVLKYIGKESNGSNLEIPSGLESGDYMFEGNKTLISQPHLPNSLRSAHYMFANCENLEYADSHQDSSIPKYLKDASGMYRCSSKFKGDTAYKPNKIINAEEMLYGTAIDEKLQQDAFKMTNSYDYENPYMNKQDNMGYLYYANSDDTKVCWEKNLENASIDYVNVTQNKESETQSTQDMSLNNSDKYKAENMTVSFADKETNAKELFNENDLSDDVTSNIDMPESDSMVSATEPSSDSMTNLEKESVTTESNKDHIDKFDDSEMKEDLTENHATLYDFDVDKQSSQSNLKKEQTLGEKSDLTGVETVTTDSNGNRIDNLDKDRTKGISNKIQEILYSVKNKKIIDIAKNLKMEETVGEKSDLTGIATVTTDSNGNSIDKLGNNEVKEISDGSLTKNEDGTVHCESDYLGTFDYDPTVFTYGYKEIQEDNGKTSQLPILKYIGQFRSGYSFNIPEGLESGDYSFEGNENLVEQPSLPKSLKSAHYMFANCKNLAYAKIGNWKSSLKEFSDKLDVPSMFTDASGMYKGATKIKSDIFAKLSNNINVQDMFGSTTTNENYKQADNNKNHASAYGFNKQGSQSNLEKESETQSTQDTSLDNSMNTAQNTSQSSSKSKFSERIYGESTSMDTSRNTSQSNSKSKFSGRIYGDGTSSNRSLPSVAEYCDDSGYGVEL